MEKRNPLFTLLEYAAIILFAYIFVNPYYLFPDGQGYFSYLPSLFHDGDLQLFNDFAGMRIPVPLALSPTGYISNNWPVGAAFFWSPFYLAGKLFADIGTSQYNTWYWFWVNFGTVFYGMLAAYLLLKILESAGCKGKQCILLAALAFFGTPAFYYSFIITANAHGITAFASALFIWYWLYSFKDFEKPWRYALLGLLLGATAMVRPQEALFGLAPAAELVARAVRRELDVKKILKYSGLLGVCFIAGISPQLLAWKIINGSFFAAPAKFNLSWSYFALDKILFSTYHGIFFWTPVYIIAFAGLIAGTVKKPLVYAGLLLVFLGQTLVNSCCVAFWEGHSFGLRQMTSLLPVAALGLLEFTKLFEGKAKGIRIAGWILVSVPVLWTAGLLAGNYFGLDLLGYLSFNDLLIAQKNVLKGIFFLPGKIAAIPRPAFGGFIAMAVTGGVLLFAASRIKNLIERKKLKVAGAVLLAIIVSFNIIIIRAALNKPPYQIPKEQTVTQEELDGFFMKQVEEIKKTLKD
ncbi:MAG: hypothetical protein ABII64_02955 [Elusimicrobiota bacterium]